MHLILLIIRNLMENGRAAENSFDKWREKSPVR
jgi:hypothetical protein